MYYKNNKSIIFLVAITLFLSVFFLSVYSSFAEVVPTILHMSYSLPSDSPCDFAAKKFGELLKERSNGRIILETYPNCALSSGDLVKAFEMVQLGSIDIHGSSPITFSNFDKRFSVFWLPWLFPDEKTLLKVLSSGLMDEVDSWCKEKNTMLLAIGNGGARQISNSVHEIRNPKDLKHSKIRVPKVQMFVELYKLLGANPVAMDFSEVYTSLQQKTIDGQENPLSTIYAAKLYEVQKYITIWNYVRDQIIWIMNAKSFESFDNETQELILECAREGMKYNNEMMVQMEKEMMVKLENKGCKITVLSPEEIDVFYKMALPIYKSYEPIIGKDIVDKFVRASRK